MSRMDHFAFFAVLLWLCLCEAFYLPALRATFFQKKAKAEAAPPHYKKMSRSDTCAQFSSLNSQFFHAPGCLAFEAKS